MSDCELPGPKISFKELSDGVIPPVPDWEPNREEKLRSDKE
jgi:hypothetical protein